jgi:hypothetical protein
MGISSQSTGSSIATIDTIGTSRVRSASVLESRTVARMLARLLLGALLPLLPALSQAATQGNCSSETSLGGRSDIALCESWESANWWQNGYLSVASTTKPLAVVSADVSNATVVSTGCLSGSCLKVDMKQYQSGALAVQWPLKAAGLAPDEVHLRYYMKLGDNFNPSLCRPDGTYYDNGGKFPGLADLRSYPEEQCGNGGAYADGINCWSGRLKFRNCIGSGNADICSADIGGKNATTRLGWYHYVPPASGNNNQAFGAFDNQAWGTDNAGSGSTCGSHPLNLGSTGSDASSCGKGAAGLVNGTWYLVELYVKMNTPGQANGISRAWINGELKYEKTNMEYRFVGHDNLHVRTVWLNIHAGGEFVGLCTASHIMLDQMVVATGARVGPFAGTSVDLTPPAVPSGVRLK